MALQSASNRIMYRFSSMCELFHVLPNKIAIRELLYFAAMDLMSWKNDWVPQTKAAMVWCFGKNRLRVWLLFRLASAFEGIGGARERVNAVCGSDVIKK
ncbi:hypothetical protein C1H46_024939 [Malus baccata]|uniref:Uncharacterized protein n=1 Tax=Malus baccata TaxID=106549 RepID=A0A540LSP5_MALBA|nr:hypothetical protein C1H46_024939 [Malus baccata]